MKSPCPACKQKGGLKKYLYGLPDGPVDEDEYAIGGCCLTGDDPKYLCTNCGWKGSSLSKKATASTFYS